MNKPIISIIALILLACNVTAEWCYQESANTTNQTGIDGNCGLNYTGKYSSSGSWNDGNWSSPISIVGTIYVNYTKPLNALNSSLWMEAHGRVPPASTPSPINYSISDSCFSQTILQFKWVGSDDPSYYLYAYCYTGTAWSLIYSSTTSGGNNVYEEAMWWNITSEEPPAPEPISKLLTFKGITKIIFKGIKRLTFR